MSFHHLLHKFPNCQLKCAFAQSDYMILWSSISGKKRDSCQRKIASKSTTVGWLWPSAQSHAQTCLNLSAENDFGWSGGCIVTLKIVQNERLIKF